mmetsp:Transcript_53169/g.172939  ORF Transcript_53169/g.172939 Transcript_53169/m.172939 type:complete len:204 (-) Transcript_53169:132-743(-)
MLLPKKSAIASVWSAPQATRWTTTLLPGTAGIFTSVGAPSSSTSSLPRWPLPPSPQDQSRLSASRRCRCKPRKASSSSSSRPLGRTSRKHSSTIEWFLPQATSKSSGNTSRSLASLCSSVLESCQNNTLSVGCCTSSKLSLVMAFLPSSPSLTGHLAMSWHKPKALYRFPPQPNTLVPLPPSPSSPKRAGERYSVCAPPQATC